MVDPMMVTVPPLYDARRSGSRYDAARDRETGEIGPWTLGIHSEDTEIGRTPRCCSRATVRLDAPGPSMSITPVVLLRSGRAELSVIVPVTAKLIVLSPVVWSAWVMT